MKARGKGRARAKTAAGKRLGAVLRRQRLGLLAALLVLAMAAGLVGAYLMPAKPPSHQAVAVLPAPVPQPPVIIVQPPEAPASPPPQVEPAWRRYAAPGPVTEQPRIAIVIDDCGLDRARTERAIALPAAVTLSFLSYAEDLPRQTAAARRQGHELLVHVPMQPINARIDMGPNGLAVDLPRDEILRRLRWDLDRFDGYVGINNHMGSRFTADPEAMRWVLGELKTRGLMFLDSRTIGHSAGEVVAAAEDVPFAARDVFLDDDQQAVAVEAQLRETEAIAKKKGTAIAIGHPHDATLAALNAWIATLPQHGIAIVPLTDIVKARNPIE